MSTGKAPAPIELMLFEQDAERGGAFLEAGLRTFIVDWECQGKQERQQGFDTEVRGDCADVAGAELHGMAALSGAEVWCRINPPGPQTRGEVERALAAGAHGLFLPMVGHPREVDFFLSCVAGRAGTGILVETVQALECVEELASRRLDRVYFGLNDFAISRGGGSIFRAVLDGSVERARRAFTECRFGFGGLTAIEAGSPLPCRRLLEEMARLRCHFSFLRRSFHRDCTTREPADIVTGIETAWRQCLARDEPGERSDRARLEEAIRGLP